MNWQYSRVDFLPSHARCFFCHRPLTRTKGIIIRDELGAENFAGANCAKKHLETSENPSRCNQDGASGCRGRRTSPGRDR